MQVYLCLRLDTHDLKSGFPRVRFLIGSTQIVLLTLSHQMLQQTAVSGRNWAFTHISKGHPARFLLHSLNCVSFNRDEGEKVRWLTSFRQCKPKRKCFIFTLWQIRGVVRFTSPPCIFYFLNMSLSQLCSHYKNERENNDCNTWKSFTNGNNGGNCEWKRWKTIDLLWRTVSIHKHDKGSEASLAVPPNLSWEWMLLCPSCVVLVCKPHSKSAPPACFATMKCGVSTFTIS